MRWRRPALWRVITAISLATAVAAAAAIPASAAVPARPATSTYLGGVVTQLVLDNGGYKSCVNDYGHDTKPGAPVKLYTCSSSDPASEWVTYPDDTIRPYDDQSLDLTVGSGNKIVLEPPISGGNVDQVWYIRADGTLVSASTTPGSTNVVLNDPGYVTKNGTQLIAFNQLAATSNAHFWLPKARYATSRLPARPDPRTVDADVPGYDWANDNITRTSMVLYMGDGAVSGTHLYESSVYDAGRFRTIPEGPVPNQNQNGGSPSGQTLGTALSGAVTGNYWSGFSSNQFVSRAPAASYTGNGPIAVNYWHQLFFAASANVTGGAWTTPEAFDWYWTYVSNKDACGKTETWVEAIFNNSGEGTSDGNITAPATCSS